MIARRWVFRMLIALLLGAITTVAVAWMCGWRSELSNEFPLDDRWVEPPRALPGDVGIRAHDLSTLIVIRFAGPGIDYVRVLAVAPTDEPLPEYDPPSSPQPPRWGPLRTADHRTVIPDDRHTMQFIAQGWPWRALWCEKTANGDDVLGGYLLFRRHVPNTFMMQHHVLALRPSWPEFAMCTAVYTSAWMVLLFVPGATRRAVRLRRGRCGNCGYDLRAATGEKCPECGA